MLKFSHISDARVGVDSVISCRVHVVRSVDSLLQTPSCCELKSLQWPTVKRRVKIIHRELC